MVCVAPAEIGTECNGRLGVAGAVGGIPHEFAQGLKVALDAIEVAGVVGDGALIRKGVDSSSVQTPSHAIAECALSIKDETVAALCDRSYRGRPSRSSQVRGAFRSATR
jgi:hypothetical protein